PLRPAAGGRAGPRLGARAAALALSRPAASAAASRRAGMTGPSFVKHAAVYGLANFLLQLGGFVLLPLYTPCLGPSDFGALEVLVRLGETMATFLLLGGLRQALLKFYQESDSPEEKARVVSAALALVVGCVAAGGAVAVALAGPLNDAFRANGHELGASL